MFAFLRRIWNAAPIATVILGAALAVGLFFAARLVAFTIYWADPAHRNQAIEAWMTPAYVAQSWGVPREAMLQGLDLTPRPGHPQSLSEIAAQRGVTLAELEAEILTIIETFRAEHPAGPGGARP
ncbi:hypothetical protein [Nioella nitratireducens]|uniref:hypothetical protein n=1 Tax=Nioella nitratireducens TaxID=1287720 RepID=UPI0008FD0F6A|nr:hypothetical protein [Nioella nitratireducens]